MKAEIGEERFARLESLKDETGDDSETFYRLNHETYKLLLKEELTERKLNNPWKK